jgi:hypothetical protein
VLRHFNNLAHKVSEVFIKYRFLAKDRGDSGRAGADGRPPGVLPMKIVSQCREQVRRVYYDAVSEAKKEIPVELIP